MRESVIQQIDVGEEDIVVKPVRRVINKEFNLYLKPWPIHVPAAAVIHEW